MNTLEQELDERYPIHEDMGEMAEFHQSYLRAAFSSGVKWHSEQQADKQKGNKVILFPAPDFDD